MPPIPAMLALLRVFIRAKRRASRGHSSRPPPNDDVHFRMLAENSGDVIYRVGRDMAPVYASPSATEIFGWTPEELLQAGPAGFVHPEDLPIVAATHSRLYSGETELARASFRVLLKGGSAIWVESNARITRDPVTGELADTVIVMRDITARKQCEDQLLALSLTDGLTGLSNRRAFDERLDQEWQSTVRTGSQMSLLLLDLDRFKDFNDLYGHQAGDDCLRIVAAAIKAFVHRPRDLAARYGGEEMAVILPDTDPAGAEAVAEDLRQAITALAVAHSSNPAGGGMVSVSVGVTTAFSRTGGTMKMPESLLLSADRALYKAKRDGRNRVVATIVFTPYERSTGNAVTRLASG